MSPTEELRAAAARLRCEHSFPAYLIGDSFGPPSPCSACGALKGEPIPVAEQLKEPLAAWLARAGDIAAYAEARGYRTATQTAQVLPEAALAVARVVLGTSPTP